MRGAIEHPVKLLQRCVFIQLNATLQRHVAEVAARVGGQITQRRFDGSQARQHDRYAAQIAQVLIDFASDPVSQALGQNIGVADGRCRALLNQPIGGPVGENHR